MTRIPTATALGSLAAALVALAALAGHAATGATTASERETGTVKTTVVASAGDKKVEVIKA
ncbi:hypothetical protein GTY86_06855 [Streptomyces sp. SID5770]|uniref:hypothetical protein n=1 Tax=Streptomyces sp. SID5770 TaxID=2690308 RepID=UPI00137118B3|nr:hypothetical protein [Streptomyces sp. SID5770]MZE51038.1 hypothetical protein [Streptomyces sp. SID5770]